MTRVTTGGTTPSETAVVDRTAERITGANHHEEDERTRTERVTQLKKCTTCGSQVDATTWHPVATEIGENDEFALQAFCSVECRNEWENG